MLEFLGDFIDIALRIAAIAILGGTLFWVAILSAKFIRKQARFVANEFRTAITDGGMVSQARSTLALDAIFRVTAAVAIVTLLALHPSTLAWMLVSGFSWITIRIDDWYARHEINRERRDARVLQQRSVA